MDIHRLAQALLGLTLFNGFTKDDLIRIFRSSNYRTAQYEKGQIIHLQNEICSAMEIILEGRVSVQKIDADGNVLRITTFSSGETIGANLIFAHRNLYPMTITADSRVNMLGLTRELILEMSQSNVLFLNALMTEISDRTLILTDKIDAISLKSIRQRICDFLRYEYHRQNSSIIIPGISKKDLAERLGIQRTSLSRELSKMRKEGLVEYNSRSISVIDLRILS